MVQKLTVDNQTATDRYLESLEYTEDLKTEITSLKVEKNNLMESLKLEKSNDKSELMAEIETLKLSLETQIGLVFLSAVFDIQPFSEHTLKTSTRKP